MLPDLGAAVVAFAERASRLTPQRQQELADIAVPVTGARGPAAVERLPGELDRLGAAIGDNSVQVRRCRGCGPSSISA